MGLGEWGLLHSHYIFNNNCDDVAFRVIVLKSFALGLDSSLDSSNGTVTPDFGLQKAPTFQPFS